MPWLSILTFLPIVGALLVGLLPEGNGKTPKLLALLVSLATLGVALAGLLPAFNHESGVMQFEEYTPWLTQVGISYHLGIDGIALWLVLLTALLSVVAVGFSWYVDKRIRAFMAMILLLEGAMIGAFSSLDLILFFTFFEATLIPMWLIIGIWGGERRAYAANKFLIYTFAGSIFLLVGMVAVALRAQQTTNVLSFDLLHIQAAVASGKFWAGATSVEMLVFWAFAIAFLVKSPVFPFHTWVPDTYGESPTAGPMLSSAMVKLGSFGFLRFCLPLFPEAIRANAPILCTLAVIGILYAAIVAAVQTDARRLLAYSSISHMGFVLLGIFSLNQTAMLGSAYQQLNHGVISCLLFLLVGYLYQRRGTTNFRDFGGLKAQMPILATLFLIAMLGAVGLPGTNGFVGEILALFGTYQAGYQGHNGLNVGFAIAAAGAMVLGAVYMLTMFQQIFYGPNDNPMNRRLRDLKPWEVGLASVLAVLIIYGGLNGSVFLKSMEPSIQMTQQMALNSEGIRPIWGRPVSTKRSEAVVANHQEQTRG